MNERHLSRSRTNDVTKGGRNNLILSTHNRIDKAGLIVCFSHLRWDFVFQRPQQILTRASEYYDVIYFEEPLFENCNYESTRVKAAARGVQVVTPILPVGADVGSTVAMQRRLLDQLLADIPHHTLIAWYGAALQRPPTP